MRGVSGKDRLPVLLTSPLQTMIEPIFFLDNSSAA
jgi:hypothetical protein